MIKLGDFHIDTLNHSDAESLNDMMLRNKEAFEPWFPLTLAANLSVASSKEFVEKSAENWSKKEYFLFAIKRHKEVAGLVYIKELDWTKKEGEFAYCIDKRFSGKGLMTKAVKTLSNHAFSSLGLETLIIIAHHTNQSSTRVAEKSGFQFIKTLEKEYTPPGGKPLDMELYTLEK